MKKTKYKSSRYRYVSIEKYSDGSIKYLRHPIMRKGQGYGCKRYDSEREAAISADIILIQMGREPVNILTKKM